VPYFSRMKLVHKFGLRMTIMYFSNDGIVEKKYQDTSYY
jgi:hypothetical protein